jgi:hypothetical protein
MAIQLATRVRRTLVQVLPKGLRVKVEPRPETPEPTFIVTVSAGKARHRFRAGWAGEGWPADVRRLTSLTPDLEVVTGTRLSDGARSLLSERGIGWADESGSADINLPSGLVVVRETPIIRRGAEKTVRWTRSMLAAAEATLSGAAPTVLSIEDATGLSRNATASALERLERLGLLERPGAHRGRKSGRQVVDANALLDAYATAAGEARKRQPVVRIHKLWNDPLKSLRDDIAPAFSHASGAWAATGAAASQLLAPYLTAVTTLDLYVDAELFADEQRLASLLNGRVVEKGHLIEVRELPTVISATGPMEEGIQLALPVRVYADLRAAGGRSAEAAQHLRETLHVGTAA